MKRVVVIDDEQTVLDVVNAVLTEMGYEVQTFSDPHEGEQSALEQEFDLLLVDLRMPGKNGAEIAASVLTEKSDANVLVITGYPGDPLARKALDAGARGLVKKPFEIAKILEYLEEKVI